MSNAKHIREVGSTEPEVASETTIVRSMSSEDANVADLVKEQPSLAQIEGLKLRGAVPDLLELPDECKPRHRVDYCYSWLAKGKNLASSIRSGGWILCNMTNSPYIKKSRFGSHGAVEQAGMLLAFMPERLYQEIEAAPARRSADLVRHYTKDMAKGDPKAPISFYEPKDVEEKD
jgi:hypothetical protein